ncbi:hypothetical protein ACQ4PT_027285 [Festuca glaucescens]
MADPNAAARRARSWVLLDTEAYIGSCNNATVAMSSRRTAAAVEVSFSLADPPGVSRCSVQCTGMAPGTWVSHARVLSAEGGLLVLGVYFTSRTDPMLIGVPRGEFFVYRSGNKPSLRLLPEPYPLHFRANSVGILLLDGGDDEYLLVHPVEQLEPPRGGWYDLHVFSSRDNTWSVKVARVEWDDGEMNASKVMAVGDAGALAWIDLWQGILTCNPLDPEPVMRLIQLPEPSPGNMSMNEATGYDVVCPRPVDVTFVSRNEGGGVVVRLVEIESLELNRRGGDDTSNEEDCTYYNCSWTATVCERNVSSNEWWSVSFKVCSSDISVAADACLPRGLLLDQEDETGCDELNEQNWNKVLTVAPTLGLHDDGHLLYIMSKLRGEDPKAWVLAFNTKTKKLQALAQFSAQRMFYFIPSYLPLCFLQLC